jgi:hypothetical protein
MPRVFEFPYLPMEPFVKWTPKLMMIGQKYNYVLFIWWMERQTYSTLPLYLHLDIFHSKEKVSCSESVAGFLLFFFWLVLLGFELRALYLLDMYSITWVVVPSFCAVVIFQIGSHAFFLASLNLWLRWLQVWTTEPGIIISNRVK